MSPPSRTSLPPPTPSHSSRLSQSSMLSSLCYSATSHQLSILQTHACMLSRFSRVSLFATLLTVACQASLSMGFSRQEYWSGLPCPSPRDLPNPGIELTSLTSSALAGRFFSTSATWKAHFTNDNVYNILQMVMYIKMKIILCQLLHLQLFSLILRVVFSSCSVSFAVQKLLSLIRFHLWASLVAHIVKNGHSFSLSHPLFPHCVHKSVLHV